jgi:hypothetical protein
LSALPAAAPEVPPDVESGSADREVPGGSKGKSPKRNTGEEEEEDEKEDEKEGNEEDKARAQRPQSDIETQSGGSYMFFNR